MKIFWSWQSDIDGKISRHFIKECLSEAAKAIGSEVDERLEIDHDTKGVLGSPSITDTILKKIVECKLFIGDVTPVAQTENGKKVMNPNVAIEMGYAISQKGDANIITIMNTSFGGINDLPFDLRHKRGPITYSLEKQSSRTQISDEKKRLVSSLKDIIKEHLISTSTNDSEESLNLDLSGPGVFFDVEKPLLRMSGGGRGTLNDKEVFVKMKSSYLYIKITPKINWSFLKVDLKNVMFSDSSFKIYPMFTSPDNTPITNKYGCIVFKFDPQDENFITDFTQLFKNGSIIGITNSFLFYSRDKLYLINLKNKLTEILEKAVCLLKSLNQSSDLDINVEIGLVNNDNCKIVLPNPDGGRTYFNNEIGPLEEELYSLKKDFNTKDREKINEIIREFILSLVHDLGQKFDYDNHVWN